MFGANHSSVAVAEANLAAILTARSKYGEAETLFVDALQILEKKPGERSLELPSILEAYALLLRLKSAEEASAMEARAKSIRTRMGYTTSAEGLKK